MSQDDPLARIKFLLASGKKSLLITLILLVTLPLLVVLALTVQRVRQQAANPVEIVDASGASITTTENPNIHIKITLPPDWKLPQATSSANFIDEVYAQEESLEFLPDNRRRKPRPTKGPKPTIEPTIIATPPASPTEVPPTPTPVIHVLASLTIENKDTDGSSGGNAPLIITSNFHNYLNTPIPWKLNNLLDEQMLSSKNIQVTFTDTTGTTSILSASTTLTRPPTLTPTASPTIIPTSTPAPGFERAAQINTSSSYLRFPANSLNPQTLTIEGWFKASGTVSSGALFEKRYQSDQAEGANIPSRVDYRSSYSLIAGSDSLSANIFTDPSATATTLSNPLGDKQWHHIALVRKTTSSPDNACVKIYVDGVASGSYRFGCGLLYYQNGYLYLGSRIVACPSIYGCEFSSFNGLVMDEVRISNTARYTSDFTRPSKPFTSDGNTLALWHFDGNLEDANGAGRNGQGSIDYVDSIGVNSTPTPTIPQPSPTPTPTPIMNITRVEPSAVDNWTQNSSVSFKVYGTNFSFRSDVHGSRVLIFTDSTGRTYRVGPHKIEDTYIEAGPFSSLQLPISNGQATIRFEVAESLSSGASRILGKSNEFPIQFVVPTPTPTPITFGNAVSYGFNSSSGVYDQSLDNLGSVSFETWVKLNPNRSGSTIFGKKFIPGRDSGGGTAPYGLSVDFNNKLIFKYTYKNGDFWIDDQLTSNNNAITPGVWTHIAITFGGNETSGQMAMYVNGSQIAIKQQTGPIGGSYDSDLFIGSSTLGELDELRISSQVRNGTGGPYAVDPWTLLLCHFNENSGNPVCASNTRPTINASGNNLSFVPSTVPLVPTTTPTQALSPTPTPTLFVCTACAADLNRDKKVNLVDYSYLLSCYNKKSTDKNITQASCSPADINGDGKVDLFDYNCLSGQFNKSCVQ